MRKILLVTITILVTTLAYSFPVLNIQNIGIKDGLSNNFVVDMTIDGQGFIWVATESGLNRIAGKKCTTFKTTNSDIANDEHVGLLYHPKSNTVWVYSKDGRVDIFNCKTQRFSHFKIKGQEYVSVADMTLAADSALWLAHYNGDIRHYDPITQKSYLISKNKLPKIKNGVRSITDDGKGNLYIGLRMDGMIAYNTRTQKSKFYANKPNDDTSLPGNNVRSVFIDHLQNVWVGTNQGLALFDTHKGSFRVFRHTKGNANSLAGDNIHKIMETQDHTLYVASDIGGISKLNLDQYSHPYYGEVVFQQMTKENYGLSSNNTRRVLQDPAGNLWIAQHSSGIDFIPNSTSPFQSLYSLGRPITNVSAIFIDSKDNLWFSQDNLISQYSQGSILHTWDFSPYISNSASSVYLFREDKQGNIWIATADNGLLCLTPLTGIFTRFQLTKDYDINALYIDDKGKVWAGTEGGIFSIYNHTERYEESINRIIGPSSIPTSIIEDNEGRLWISTLSKGVFVFDKAKHLVARLGQHDSFPSQSVNQLLKDENGSIWIATHKGLVWVENPKNPKSFKVYQEEQGIKDCHIQALVQDRQGNIWASMLSGIACFIPSKQKFYNYDFQSGITMGNFVTASAAVSPTGRLYFGSPSGICTFDPQLIFDQKELPILQIINCEKLESQANHFTNSIIPRDDAGIVHLRYDENTFRISFTITDPSQEGNVEYSYMMKGLDDKWYETEGDNEVTFRNLKPGEYTFLVRTKFRNQDWDSSHVAEQKVIITPPFWLTWWAKLLYALLVISIAYYLLRLYMREIQLRNSLDKAQWENKQKQMLNEERLRFFTNITHELRTPLTLVIGPLEDLKADKRLPEALTQKVSNIHKSAERLLGLINELLEFRKTETQNRRLTVARTDLSTWVQELGNRFKDLNRNSKVAINISVPTEPVVLYFDSEVINTIVNNFMSNAMKYTADGNIVLSLTKHRDKVSISVKDTGYGISQDALSHIYDRYYQAKGIHQAAGTGIGLALVKSLAELHKAELNVDSQEGIGSTFTFTLDAYNTYPDALHKEDAEPIESIEAILPVEKTEESENDKPTVLIIEDNADIRQYIKESLSEDYRILEANNGKEGRDSAFAQMPDIIVSDIMMPEMNGIEMTSTLKKDIRTSHIPIILLTAKTSVNDQEEGYNCGADSYLMKPFSARLLHSRIRNLLSCRRRLAEFVVQHSTIQMSKRQSDTESTNVDDNNAEAMSSLSPLDERFIAKLNQLVLENIKTEDIDIAFMTDKMAMSHSTFYRKVKALTGMSANEYIRNIKLHKGMELLRSGEYNVSEVAMQTGFNNIGYFRRCFKKEYGISPSEVLKKQ